MTSSPGRIANKAADNVLSFFDAGLNRPKPVVAADEPRGRVLLFTGVRYQRDGQPDGSSPSPSPSLTGGSQHPTRGGRRG